MFDNKPESIEQDGACIFSGIIGGEVLKKLENVGECGMLGVFSHDGVFLFWFLKRIQLVAEHFKLFSRAWQPRVGARLPCHLGRAQAP
ncbi:MAG: hypothetical protein MR890_00620 [Akkermansia muciniphila]|nr:hypothetical protein [Akkermansia muciniphila]MCI7003908.1 hypothetical protein [Akkermansia muciniphila]